MKKKTITFDTGKTVTLDLYPEDLSFDQVKKILKIEKLCLKPFYKWFYGQTGPIIQVDGHAQFGVYKYDLDRYIEWKKGGRVPDWD